MSRKSSNGSAATETSFPPKVCDALQGMAGARKTAKDRLSTLVQRRDELDEELNQLGAGHSADHLERRSEMVITLRAIKWQRARIKRLSDSIDELLLNPNAPDAMKWVPDYTRHDADEAELFGGDLLPYEDDSEGEGDEEVPEGAMDATEGMADKLAELVPGRFVDQNGQRFDFENATGLRVFLGDRTPAGASVAVISSKQYGTRIDIKQGKAVLASFTHEAVEPAEPADEPARKRRKPSGA